MMISHREHILYVSIIEQDQASMSKMVSENYGYGIEDHAIIYRENFNAKIFNNELDFSTFSKFNCYKIAKNYSFCQAIDDNEIQLFLPYAIQTYNIMRRQLPKKCEMGTFERLYIDNIQFWIGYLKFFRIGLVIFYTWPHEGTDFIIYQSCKTLNIKTIIFCLSLIPERCYAIQSIEDDLYFLKNMYDRLQEKYKNVSEDKIELRGEYAEVFAKMSGKNCDKTPYYMQKCIIRNERLAMCIKPYCLDWIRMKCIMEKRTYQYLTLRIVLRAIAYSMFIFDLNLTKGSLSSSLFPLFNAEARKSKELNKEYIKLSKKADYQKKYIYYPLHFQPECTSNPQGGGIYYDQLIPIRMLAETVPEGVYIYVKEHPKQLYGARTVEFYRVLNNIPNVVLIDSRENTYDLINHCIAVSTLTGTAGWEGLFQLKPFIMFGYWVTQHMPGVYHVRTKKECKKAIDDILEGSTAFNRRDLKIFFKAMDETEAYQLNPERKECSVEIEKRVNSCFDLFERSMKFYYGKEIEG